MGLLRLPVYVLIPILVAAACSNRTPPPDIVATVQAAVIDALPAPTFTPAPDVEATVVAAVQEALAALPPTPTIVPTFTPTASPRVTVTAVPTITVTPTHTAIATPPPTATASVTPTPSTAELISAVEQAVVRIQTPEGVGSGFVFDEEGLALTNAHVVGAYQQVTVYIGEKFTFTGTVVGLDEEADLAVIKLELQGVLPSLSLGDSDLVRVGDDVIAIGYPLSPILGTSLTATTGVVSSKRRFAEVVFLQTDAAINPGNSGGPLLNGDGEVIGVITARIADVFGEPIQGIGLAISSNTVSDVLSILSAGGIAQAATPTPGPPTIFTSQEYWYSISVPSGWSTDDPAIPRIKDPAHVVISKGLTAVLSIRVLPYDRSTWPDFRAFVRFSRPSLPEGGSDLHVEPEVIVASDQPIVRRDITYTYSSTGRRKVKALWVVLGDIYFWIRAVAAENDWSEVESAIDSMLASFDPTQFVSSKFNYSVSTPPGWSLDESQGDDVILWDPNSTANLHVISRTNICSDVSSYAQTIAAPTYPEFGFKIADQGPERESEDTPAWRFEWTHGDTEFRGLALYTLKDCLLRQLQLSASEEDWNVMGETLEAIVQRFNVR